MKKLVTTCLLIGLLASPVAGVYAANDFSLAGSAETDLEPMFHADIDTLIDMAENRFTWSVRVAGVKKNTLNRIRGQIAQAREIYYQLRALKESGDYTQLDLQRMYKQLMRLM